MRGKLLLYGIGVATVIVGLFAGGVSADRFSSTSYIIDASTANNFGGTSGSASYSLTSSGGESVIGNGAGGSYKVGMGYVAQLDKSLSLTVQPSGLIGYWPLDENTGKRAGDTSLKQNHGNLPSSGVTWAPGKLGSSLQFDGTNKAVPFANTTDTQSSTISVSMWVKSTSNAKTITFMEKPSAWWIGASWGAPAVYNPASGVTCKDNTVNIADGAWHFIAATFNLGVTNGTTLYMDGSPRQTCTVASLSQTSAPQLNTTTAGNEMVGMIDNVKMFSRVMSADEIMAEYATENAGYDSGVSLGSVVAGTSNTASADVIVQTDASGYSLAISQNNNLTNGSDTIPAITGSIASPATWLEGTTKGLGFTLTGTNATAINGSWSGGASYAAFPNTATSFYTRTGSQSSPDYLTVKLRLDVAPTQVPSTTPYTNLITITGTMTP